MSTYRKIALLILASLVVFQTVWFVLNNQVTDKPLKAIPEGFVPFDPSLQISDFNLNNQKRELVTKRFFKEQWSIVFLGFSRCNHVCPVSLAVINSAIKDMPSGLKGQVQGVFVTVDPDYDTVDRMKDYLKGFNSGITGLTGPLNEIHKLSRSIKADFTSMKSGESDMDHSPAVFVINPNAEVIGVFPYADKPSAISGFLKTRLKQGGEIL